MQDTSRHRKDIKEVVDRHQNDVIMTPMELSRHVAAIQADLAAAAGLGDDATAEAGRRLSAALESSLHLRLLDVLTETALDLDLQLSGGRVEVRLAGREPQLVLIDDARPAEEPAPGDDLSARITLRLPDALKSSIQKAADSEGISSNAWVVRALARALEPRSGRIQSHKRIQGFARS
jgi:hypothetical protein